MHIKYSSSVNREDWHYVLEHADLANTFHAPEYFDIQTSSVGHTLLYGCCYSHNEPIAVIVGVRNNSGYHQGLIEIGTKSGGYPLMINHYDQRSLAKQIKNDFIRHFATQHLSEQRFIFYPCFHLDECILEEPVWQCTTQYDATAFLNLRRDEDALFWRLTFLF